MLSRVLGHRVAHRKRSDDQSIRQSTFRPFLRCSEVESVEENSIGSRERGPLAAGRRAPACSPDVPPDLLHSEDPELVSEPTGTSAELEREYLLRRLNWDFVEWHGACGEGRREDLLALETHQNMYGPGRRTGREPLPDPCGHSRAPQSGEEQSAPQEAR